MKYVVSLMLLLLCAVIVNGANVVYSTGMELINLYPYKAKSNFYDVLAGENNVIVKKSYSQFRSPGIENFKYNAVPLGGSLDALFTDLQMLIVNDKIQDEFFENPMNALYDDNGQGEGSGSVVINNSGSSNIVAVNSMSNGMNGQMVITNNNASGRLGGNDANIENNVMLLPNNNHMREDGSINASSPSLSSGASVNNTPAPSKPSTTSTSTSTTPSSALPPSTSSLRSSGHMLKISLTLLLIVLLF